MSAEGSMNATTFDAENDAKVDGNPLGLDTGAAISAPTISLIGVADYLEELRRVFFEAIAFASAISRPRAYGCSSVHAVGSSVRICVGWGMMGSRVG